MLFELGYHRWSPKYRRGDDIEDPLHLAPFDVDGVRERGRERERERERERDQRDALLPGRNRGAGLLVTLSTPPRLSRLMPSVLNAGCATMSPHAAIGVSFVSALLYHVSYRGFICLMIDDAVSAGAVHLVCGAWGVIAAGFTGMEGPRLDAGYPPQALCSRGVQVGTNFVMVAIIAAYAYLCTFISFGRSSEVVAWWTRPKRASCSPRASSPSSRTGLPISSHRKTEGLRRSKNNS
ncbi:unnamed protein product [Ectocarpus sp. 8 AP-2014]